MRLSLLPDLGFLILVERRGARSTPRFTRPSKNATITFRRIDAMNESKVTVVGAGLAGSEAAYQLARRGIRVRLVEMRPIKMTEAHRTSNFAELVCSNSLRN
ncbi:FAD-dependent oxidoreductase, partial [Candidatus Binatus sp.]|uniref:FAD-dependent oxidoreductase n=1 Tax=Candidatus Binatus sp. TaxID=2811406 RepID=UPI003BB18ADD